MPVKREPVHIDYPVNGNTYASPVSVTGTCSQSGAAVTVHVSTSTTTVTANGNNWATSGFALGSKQQYVASASVPGASSNVTFHTS